MKSVYKIPQEALHALFTALHADMPLYLPTRQVGGTDFAPWTGHADAVDLLTLKTLRSPKQFFLPAVEELYRVNAAYDVTPAPVPKNAFILFGVRGCDAAALLLLDRVFLHEPIDATYQARRNAARVITLACEAPDPTCFCAAFDIDAAAPEGDVRTWLASDALYWQPLTEKGVSLTEKMRPHLTPIRKAPKKREDKNAATQIIKNFAPVPAHFDSSVWEDAHRTCLACGTCTFLCPTCHCYDLAHEETPCGGGTCQRWWDVCLSPTFTQMAHGNPRPTKKERFRQRYMHKLVYFHQNHGKLGCVGCGRCVTNCPARINIVGVAQALTRARGGNA